MLTKFSTLKDTLKNNEAKTLCESAIVTLSSTIYTNITNEAKFEIENSIIKNLFEGLRAYANDDANLKKWLDTETRLYNIKNIGVRQAVNNIMIKEGESHPTLKIILEGWKSRLHNTPEVMLYEGFVAEMSKFSFIPSVEESISNILENVNSYDTDISLSKIIEEMRGSNSSYLVPLIEDVVNNYVTNKNAQTKSFLKEVLNKFSYDNYVKQLLELASVDAVSLKLESANSNNTVSKIYSPIAMFENGEVLFNVKGDFYIRKGNSINRVPKKELTKIDEGFIKLCNILNNNNIEILDTHINVYKGSYKSVITESEVTINDKVYNKQSINEAVSSYNVGGHDIFDVFSVSNILCEHFNDIAEIDFVKRVTSRCDEGHYADIFKLRDNVYITTADLSNGKKTFYRGVNPLQARNIMMEHMSHDVSSVFENILPQYNKILKDINNTKTEYVKYIELLESNISNMNSINHTVSNEVYTELVNELNQVKAEYRDYLIEAEVFLRPNNKDEEYVGDLCEGFTITIRDDKTGSTQTVAIPDNVQAPNSMNQMIDINQQQDSVPSAVTYDEDQSQLMAPVSVKAEGNIELPVDVNSVEQEAEEIEKEREASEEENSDNEDAISNDNVSSDIKQKKKLTIKKDIEESYKGKGELNETSYKKFKLKRKLNESLDIRLNDKVTIKGKKGYVLAQEASGNYVVMMPNGSTISVEPSKIVLVDKGIRQNSLSPKMIKFSEKTQQALMEQYVKCGVYFNNTPLKLNNCSIKYSEWCKANEGANVSVLVDGNTQMFPKGNIRILENVNDFANIANYVPAKLTTVDSIVNVLANILDRTNSTSDASPIRTLTIVDDEVEPNILPANTISNFGMPFDDIIEPQEVIVISDEDDNEDSEDIKSFEVKFEEDKDSDDKCSEEEEDSDEDKDSDDKCSEEEEDSDEDKDSDDK